MNLITLVPVYSAETRPIEKIGCDDCISSLDIVDTFTIGRSDADGPAGVRTSPPPVMRSCGLRGGFREVVPFGMEKGGSLAFPVKHKMVDILF